MMSSPHVSDSSEDYLGLCFHDYCIICDTQCAPGGVYCSSKCRHIDEDNSRKASPSLFSQMESPDFSPEAQRRSSYPSPIFSIDSNERVDEDLDLTDDYSDSIYTYEVPTLEHSTSVSSTSTGSSWTNLENFARAYNFNTSSSLLSNSTLENHKVSPTHNAPRLILSELEESTKIPQKQLQQQPQFQQPRSNLSVSNSDTYKRWLNVVL